MITNINFTTKSKFLINYNDSSMLYELCKKNLNDVSTFSEPVEVHGTFNLGTKMNRTGYMIIDNIVNTVWLSENDTHYCVKWFDIDSRRINHQLRTKK